MTGQIFNIQRFSVHDGPGIRDIVFFKGCPLRCLWCSNPESQSREKELSFNAERCIGTKVCGYCAVSCPTGALCINEQGAFQFQPQLCSKCGGCVSACPTTARKILGRDVTVEEVIEELQNQAGSWRANGGVTLSGGEPLMQADFATELLRCLRGLAVHTAIETCGFAPWEALKQVATYCDVVFFDIKSMEGQKHFEFTRADNKPILANLVRLRKEFPELELIVRTPVIPGFNDTEEALTAIARFLGEVGGIHDYELLPYHNLGENKYTQLGRKYAMAGVPLMNRDEVTQLNDRLRKML